MKKMYCANIVVAVCLFLVAATDLCRASDTNGAGALTYVPGYVDPEPAFVAWLNQPWSGDDSPYAELRAKLDKAESAGTLPALVDSSEVAYRAAPKSLTVQFVYFYALILNHWEGDTRYTTAQQTDIDNFSAELFKLTYPHTYNYTRLSILGTCLAGLDVNLYPFLLRLAAKDSGDLIAKFDIPVTLASTDKTPLQLLAIREANALVSEYPNVAVVRTAQGFAYYRRWLATKDPDLAQMTINSYRAYLSLASPNGRFRPVAEHIIQLVQSGGP